MKAENIINPKSVKGLVVAEWVAAKAFREKGKCGFRNDIFAIIKESEKAMYVMLGSINDFVYTWIPKSQVSKDKRECETYIVSSYEECEEVRKFQLSFVA